MKRLSLLFSAALLLFAACQKEPGPCSEPTPANPITLTAEEAVRLPLLSDSYAVSHQEAEAYARSLAAALIRNGTTTKGISLLGTAGVIDSILSPAVATKADAPQGKVYVVDLGHGKGYVLTPGDNRIPEKILGYSDEGSFEDTKDNPSFNYAMECLTAYVAAETERIEELRGDSVYMALCAKLGLDSNGGASKGWAEEHNGEFTNIRVEPVGEPWTEVVDQVVLMSSKWGQRHPYNNIITQRTGTNYPTGCVATAMAQIMNFHKYGTFNGHTYQWENFSTYGGSIPSAEADLGLLFWDLGLPANLNMKYGIDGSSAPNENVPRTFSAFGYNSGTVQSYNASTVVFEIERRRPVYLYGVNKADPTSAHAWVVDGTEAWKTLQNHTLYYYNMFGEIIHEETEVREIKYPSYGFHQNWGWGGTGNNWLAAGYFTVISVGTHYDFGKNNKMITGIRPK